MATVDAQSGSSNSNSVSNRVGQNAKSTARRGINKNLYHSNDARRKIPPGPILSKGRKVGATDRAHFESARAGAFSTSPQAREQVLLEGSQLAPILERASVQVAPKKPPLAGNAAQAAPEKKKR